MRILNRLQAVLAVLLLFGMSASAGAQCISTVRTVSQPVVFPSHAAGPVAWTGSVLGVAKIDIGSSVVYFATYDANLNQLTADRVGANASLNGPIALIWNGSEFALFYQTGLLQLVFQRIAVSGEPIGTPIAVAPQHLNWQNQEYDIAWDSRRNAYDIIHTIPTGTERGLWLTIVDRDGKLQYDQSLSIYFSSTAEPRLAVAPSGEIGIAWVRLDEIGETLYFLVFGSDNNVKAVERVSVGGRNARLAASDTTFLIITGLTVGGGTGELRSVRVDLKGAIIANDSTFLPARGVDIAPVSLLWNPTLREWALIYSESQSGFNVFPGETRLRRFDFRGAVSDTLFAPDPTKNIFAMTYPHVWTGTSYVGSISRPVPRSEGSDTHLVKHCPLLSSVSGPSYTALYGLAQFTAAANGGTPDYRYQWDFGDTGKAEGRTPSHQYIRTGTYVVTLTITDSAGGVTVSTMTVNVVVPKRRAAGH